MSDPNNPPPSELPSEPATDTGKIVAALGLVLSLAVSFGLPLTDQQQIDVLKAVAVLYPLLVYGVSWVIRNKVYAPDTTQALRIEAFRAGERGGALPPLAKPPADATLTA